MQIKIEYVFCIKFEYRNDDDLCKNLCVFERYKTKTFILRNIFLVENKIESSKPKETVSELT
jgi:hypothetical protein